MSRLYRPFRTLFRSSKIASLLQDGQTVRVERVRLKKGKTGFGFIGTVFKGVVVLELISWAITPASDPDSKDSKPPRRRLDDKEKAHFIPFPLTLKEHPRQPYRASDPEWQEFVRISRDKKLQSDIRRHMARLVLHAVSQTPSVMQKVGPDARVWKYWIDLDYPYSAPPVYERSGILVTDEALEWVTAPCDPWLATSLRRVLWPKPLALGVWATATETAKETAFEMVKYFGFASDRPSNIPAQPTQAPPPPPLPPTPNSEMQKALQRIRQQATRRPEEVNDPGSMSSTGALPTTPTRRDKAVSPSDKAASDATDGEEPAPKSRIENMVISLPNSQPWKRLKETYYKERGPFRAPPPRGSVCVSGIVELETTKAWIAVDVITWYDPKTHSFAAGTTYLRTRRVQFKEMRALRR